MRTTHHPGNPGRRLHSPMKDALHLAALTPHHRNRAVDFLRVFAIAVVVAGHWLMAAPEVIDDNVRIGHLLADVPWVQGLTWVLQVMPIFFFVGGYSNATAWRSARRDGIPYAIWLRSRLRRLVLPALPVLALWVPIALVALATGVDAELLRLGSQAALVPTWFLAAYVVIVLTTPLTLRAWERLGWGAAAGFAAAAAIVDVLSLGVGWSALGWVNYVFVWNAVHILGYAWLDDRIGGTRIRMGLAVAGLAALAALVALGPYPVAMVGIDGAAVTNSNPPKVTLVALGLFQLGIATALERPLRRWLENSRAWSAVIAVSSSIMTVYLWHLTVLVGVVGASLLTGGVGLGIPVGSAAWWLTRPLWLGLLGALTIPVVAALGRFERPAPDERPAPAPWRPVLAVAAVCAGLGLLARHGIADAGGINTGPVALVFAGVLVGGLVRTRRTPYPGLGASSDDVPNPGYAITPAGGGGR